MSDNPLTVQKDDSLSGILKRPEYRTRFDDVLGERAPQFISSLLSVGSTMKDVEPRSIVGSAMVAAALDLPIDKNLGFAWIVPYKRGGQKFAQFQMGAKGFVQLALRSGQYSRMNSSPINREVFEGYDEVGEPRLNWDNYDPEKEIWGYFFGFQLVNGFVKKSVWKKDKILEHAKRYSQAYKSDYDTPWKSHFDGMAEKTVVANTLRRWGPLSVQMQRAITSDQGMIKDIDAEVEYIDGGSEPQPPQLEHPEKLKQAEAEKSKQQQEKQQEKTKPAAKAETKTEKAPEKTKAPENVVQMPPKEEPKKEETKQEPKPEECKPAETSPADDNQPDTEQEETEARDAAADKEQAKPTPPAATDLSAAQKRLQEEIEGRGHTFVEFLEWGSTSIFKNPPKPTGWAGIPEEKASYFITSIKGIDSALKTWKSKRK